ncbi:hypothetical protein HUU62_08535 [Rhodoferax sp. 4810]|uniref:Uncharacterized protein n=1 Tax=Thiospirillum jenense TaxID=1653858 RepID=A0A839HDV4_9GAMM|nr:hypothetical protein [Thiospirillum jenense]MBB1074455.1 hypothetical protein [Rhodoferax jenense]MBB1125566.1 hypothetical protein [Thiospirillum jenense]
MAKPRAETYAELKRNLQHTLHLHDKLSRHAEKSADMEMEIAILSALAVVQRRRVESHTGE